MKWFFKWLRNGLESLDNNRSEEKEWLEKYRASPGLAIGNVKVKQARASQIAAGTRDDTVNLNASAMHFRIYPATGGYIVEYQYYDEKNDRNHQALHLIPSELDMGTELSKILTLEALKR